MMRRSIRFAVAVAVVVGAVAGPAAAARRSGQPSTTTFFLRASDPGCQTGFGLSIEDGDDATNCGFIDGGAPQEVTQVVLNERTTERTWSAYDGLPLKVDASRPLTTDITLKSFQPVSPAAIGVGQAVFELTFTGFSSGERVELGTGEATYVVTPGTFEYKINLELDVPDELQGKVINSLEMTTVVRGAVALHGAFSVDDPSSTISLPTLSRRRS